MNSMMKWWRVPLALAAVSLAPAAFSAAESHRVTMPADMDANGQAPRLLSAFFGLDNSLPFGANRLCLGASGEDGMPVVLSHTIDPETLQAEDFSVVRRSGVEATPMCVTLRPALDVGEKRTVLLIGEFGNADNDPPAKVRVVGDLLSDGMNGGQVNFRGTETQVIPLDAGPTLVWAGIVPEEIWSQSGRGSACPTNTQQVVRVTWAGGVKLPNGDEPGDAERMLYRVTVAHPDGSKDVIAPAALADLGDNDNNHLLCLDTTIPATAVAFPAGHLVDPNGDLNPDAQIAVVRVAETAGNRQIAHDEECPLRRPSTEMPTLATCMSTPPIRWMPFNFGTLATPDDAYRYAQGEAIKHPGGFDMQLDRPLDFYAVTDHGFYLGVVRAGADTSTEISTYPAMKPIHNLNAPENLTLESIPTRNFRAFIGGFRKAMASSEPLKAEVERIMRYRPGPMKCLLPTVTTSLESSPPSPPMSSQRPRRTVAVCTGMSSSAAPRICQRCLSIDSCHWILKIYGTGWTT